MSSWEICFGIIAIWVFVGLGLVMASKTGEYLAAIVLIFLALYFTNSLLQLLPARSENDDGKQDDQPPPDR